MSDDGNRGKLILHYAHNRTDVQHFRQDGLFDLMEWLTHSGVVTEVLVVNTAMPNYKTSIGWNIEWLCLPDSTQLIPWLEPNDVVFVRGGYKPTDFYEHCKQSGIPMIFYGANTGRERWGFWDVVLDDLQDIKLSYTTSNNTVVVPYRKPIKDNVFYMIDDYVQEYDVCLGASNIHDKKGQWFGVEVVEEYERVFKKKLRAVMPGKLRGGGINTVKAMEKIERGKVDVELTGELPRNELARLFNKTRLFLHLGSGQNDRSLLEANACGCPALIRYPQYHEPVTYEVGGVNMIAASTDDPHTVALQVASVLSDLDDDYYEREITWREETAVWTDQQRGVSRWSGPLFLKLVPGLRRGSRGGALMVEVNNILKYAHYYTERR
jgi:hypothetical protein